MSAIYTSADQLIGHTPLLELTHIEKAHGLKAKILASWNTSTPPAASRTASPRPWWTMLRPRDC